MKSKMPRLIDDKRRENRCMVAFGIAMAAVVSYFAYGVWMRQFTDRREKLSSVISEGQTEMAKLLAEVDACADRRIQEALNSLGDMGAFRVDGREVRALDLDTTIYVADDQNRAERLKSESAAVAVQWGRATRDLSVATNVAVAAVDGLRQALSSSKSEAARIAASNLGQCLGELKVLQAQFRPGAKTTAEAIERFNKSYAYMAKTRVSLAEWSNNAEVAISNAMEAVEAGKTAARNVNGLVEKFSSIENDVKALRVDRLRFAEGLFEKARLIRREMDSIMQNTQRAGNATEQELSDAGKSMDALVESMKALFRDNGNHVSLDTRKSLVDAAKELEAMDRQVREDIANWNDVGKRSVAQVLDVTVEQVEAYAKALRDGSAEWNPDRSEVSVGVEVVEQFRRDANAFLESIEKVPERAKGFVQKAKAAVEEAGRALPDWGAKTMAINQERQRLGKDILEMTMKINGITNSLASYHSDGNVHENIRQVLVSAHNELTNVIAGKVFPLATNSREFKDQSEKHRSFVKLAHSAIDNGKKAIAQFNTAVGNGTLYKIVYKSGYEVWSRKGAEKMLSKRKVVSARGQSKLILSDAIAIVGLSPYAPVKKLGWKFSLKIPKAGEHELQITPSTDSATFVNETAKGMGTGKSRNGKVEVSYTLLSSNGVFEKRSSFSFDNGQKLAGRKSLSFEGSVQEGWIDIEFFIDSIALVDVKKHSPDESMYWNYDSIIFTITLDGEEVELYHAERER